MSTISNMDILTRTTKVVEIFKKLNGLNLGISCFDEFISFRKICNTFIRDGISVKGSIKVLGTKRIICYDFNEKDVVCFLKYDDSV